MSEHVGGYLGVILGATVAALLDNGSTDDEIRHLTEVALASSKAVKGANRP